MADETKNDKADEGKKPDAADKTKGDGGEGGKPDVDGDPKAHIHKLNEENKARRLENEKLTKDLDETKGVLRKLGEALGGKPGAESEAVKAAAGTAEARSKRILLRSEVTALGAKLGANDPRDLERLLDLADVAVDLEKETVDSSALEKKLGELKKSKPYLFKAEGDGEKPPPKGTDAPDPTPHGGKGSKYQQFRALSETSQTQAAAFYNAHKKEIEASRPK